MGYGAEFEDDAADGGDDEPEENAEIERLCREALGVLEDGDSERARELAGEAVAIDDEHPFPLFVLGVIAEHEGDFAAARYLSEQALRTASTNADAIQFRAQLHVREYEFDQAENILQFGVVHNPEDPQLLESLARVYLATGRHEQAVTAAQASLRIDPTSPGALAVRVAALEESGDSDTLLAVLRQSVQMHPEDPYTMVELAAVEAEQGNVDRARVLLARAQRLAPREQQVGEVRLMIEGSQGLLLLRPLPRALRWLREFPGGLAGFLLAFVVAALPLHELTLRAPAYALPAWVLMGAWATFAAWCWVGPELLNVHLNRLAAAASRERLLAAPADNVDLERILDTVALYLLGRQYRRALNVLFTIAPRAQVTVGPELERLARELSSPGARILQLLASLPAVSRILTALAFAFALGAPVIASLTGYADTVFHGLAIVLAIAAFGVSRIVPRQLDRVGRAGAEIRLLLATDAEDRRRGHGDSGDLRAAG